MIDPDDYPSPSELAGPPPPERTTLWWCGECAAFVPSGHAAWHVGGPVHVVECVYELLPEGETA